MIEKNNKKLFYELIGIMLGDGCLSKSDSKHIVYISGHKIKDYKYHNQVTRNIFKKLFNKDIKIEFRRFENTLFIRFSDKQIFQVLNKFLPIGTKYGSIKLPEETLRNQDYFNCMVRGLFDTDGCVVLSKQHRKIPYYPRFEIASKSRKFLEGVLELLERQGFYGSVSKKGKHFRLEIPGFKNLEKWMLNIGTNHNKNQRNINYILKNKKIL